MNIAIVTTWFPAGAGYVSKAYRETLEKENTVYIYARGGKNMEGDPVWDDEAVTWAPMNFYNNIKVSHFLKWLKTNKIDVILFNEQRYWEPVVQAKKEGYVIGSYIDYYTEETVPLFEIYDFLICNTKRHYSVFDWHPNCIYIPWGTNTDVFKPESKLAKRPITFIISLGWAGNYTGDRKGVFFAVQAFKQVQGECVLKIFSQIPLKECSLEWRNLIESDSRILFIVGTFDPFPFSEGDVYVYPSRLDGIGLSLPEAISSGLACITTDNAPMNEFVIDNYNGRLVKVARFISRTDGYYWPQSIVSLDSLVSTMQWYVINEDKVLEHGEKGRLFALKELSWEANSRDLNSCIKLIVESKVSCELDSEHLLKSVILDRRLYPSFIYRFMKLFTDHFRKYFGFKIAIGNRLKRLK
jgi:glycosyltransferase involved in cell wall biosynthesis